MDMHFIIACLLVGLSARVFRKKTDMKSEGCPALGYRRPQIT